ncbi:MAG: NAD(P)/FAD-dependent oxidoreductase [Actinobacteria bacterium]|nr:NAD(P)/FAD-dependent oxidoreductase [Actinomycetota bacterium]
MTSAVVVGSGPNGLAAALTLARAGVRVTVIEAHEVIGGGTRTSELTLPGLLHDHCSAIHPMGVASPFMQQADLAAHGVEWLHPEVALAHPLGGGRAAALHRSLDETAEGLGVDGASWRRLFGWLADHFDGLAPDILGPLLGVPRHPLALAAYGSQAVQPTSLLVKRWSTPEARALFGGVAAHAYHPLTRPLSSAIGLMLTAVAHRYGWPVPRGGSRAITDALAAQIVALGGTIETGRRVTTLDEVSGFDLVLLDLAPKAVAELAGERLPQRVRRAYERYRHAPGAFKLDLAVDGGIPWLDEHSRRAGTVHVGGTIEEIVAAEAAVFTGRMPERPFVLVGQQYLADPSRSVGDIHPVWVYGHVPHGYQGDATAAILNHIERYAPGTRDRIVASSAMNPAQFEAYNPNYVGGDVITGANTMLQLAFRPRFALDPYSVGIDGVFICSAATPPGAGVHGMCGDNAARAALRHLERC